MPEMKTRTMKRSDEEEAADQAKADKAGLSLHAWRRAVLNTANGMSDLHEQLTRVMAGKRGKKS